VFAVIAFYVSVASLNLILDATGSQCRSLRCFMDVIETSCTSYVQPWQQYSVHAEGPACS
jgi:hypothetical protein